MIAWHNSSIIKPYVRINHNSTFESHFVAEVLKIFEDFKFWKVLEDSKAFEDIAMSEI